MVKATMSWWVTLSFDNSASISNHVPSPATCLTLPSCVAMVTPAAARTWAVAMTRGCPHQGAAQAVPYLSLIEQLVEHVLVPLGQSLNVAVKQLLLLLLIQLLRQVPAVVLAQLLAGLAPPQLCGAYLFGADRKVSLYPTLCCHHHNGAAFTRAAV